MVEVRGPATSATDAAVTPPRLKLYNPAEIGGPMRHLLFLAVAIGVIALIDATQFKGQARAAIWQQVQHQGQLINMGVERSIKQHLW